jgi:hypothetical protein
MNDANPEEIDGLLTDPDEGLELRPEFIQSLEEFLAGDQRGIPAADVFRSLGLEWDTRTDP